MEIKHQRVDGQHRPSFLQEINSPLTYAEGLKISQEKKFYAGIEGDARVFDEIEQIRAELEPLEGWKKSKELAREELEKLPEDTLDRLNERFIPYIKNLPAGHGRGHLSRDFIGLSLQLRDPDFTAYDSVEILVGILGGLYHDIGNSVVERYDDSKRFAGHAEVGAHLFGKIAGEDLPPQIKKLTQYAIAAHTNYLKEISVTRDGQTKTRRPYKGHSDIVEDEEGVHKAAVWIARNTDRLDLLTPPFINVRHFATKAMPTMDFDGDTFHEPSADEISDFRHQFRPVLRSQEERAQSQTKQEQVPNVLEHLQILAESARYGKYNPKDLEKPRNDYSKYDTDYFTGNLAVPAIEDQARFLRGVVEGDTARPEEDVRFSFENFYRALRKIEPAHDTPFVEDQFRRKFSALTPSERSRWSQGFDLLLGEISQRTSGRILQHLAQDPAQMSDEASVSGRKVRKIISSSLQPLAEEAARQYASVEV